MRGGEVHLLQPNLMFIDILMYYDHEKVLYIFVVFVSPTVLALSLGDTKQVVLCDVEKAEILHMFPVENPVSCMHWMEVMEESR